jgi:hypothetical protein
MKISTWTMALAVAAAMAVAGVRAQTVGESDTAYTSDAYYAQGKDQAPSPSDRPAPAPPAPGAPAANGGCGDNNGCNNGCCDKCGCEKCQCSTCGHERCCELDCGESEVVRLFDEFHCLSCCGCNGGGGIKLDGWLDAGYTYNSHNPDSRFNGPMTFNDRDEMQINQFAATLHKDIAAENCGWDWGLKIQAIYGTDARFFQSTGLELNRDGSNRWNSERFYQLAMPELFGIVAYDDWQLVFGHYVTNMTLETIDPRNNFFYSHSYAFSYAVPYTHTGAFVTRPFQNIQGSWAAGVFQGWDRFEDDNDELSFQGHVQFDNDDKTGYVRMAFISGDEVGLSGIDANRTAYTLIVSTKFGCDRWQYIFVHDAGWQEDGVAPDEDATWYSFGNYLIYQINCCWSTGFRLEAFRDDDGTRVAAPTDPRSIGGIPQGMSGNPATGPFEGNFWEASWGLNWKPNPNVTVRPEFRYDWFEGTGNPYNDNSSIDQFTAAIDVVVQW